jgi:hypothetical protein
MKAFRISILVLIFILFSFSLVVDAAAPSVFTATAEFYANPTGCIFTSSDITVVQTTTKGGGRPVSTTTVELTYVVKSVCDEPGDNLYYHDFHTEGPYVIDSSAFSISNNLSSASLNAVIPAYDEESGSTNNLSVHVEWDALSNGGNVSVRAATASLNVPQAENPFLYGFNTRTNPIDAAVSAELSKS